MVCLASGFKGHLVFHNIIKSLILETSVLHRHLTWLTAQEDFAEKYLSSKLAYDHAINDKDANNG